MVSKQYINPNIVKSVHLFEEMPLLVYIDYRYDLSLWKKKGSLLKSYSWAEHLLGFKDEYCEEDMYTCGCKYFSSYSLDELKQLVLDTLPPTAWYRNEKGDIMIRESLHVIYTNEEDWIFCEENETALGILQTAFPHMSFLANTYWDSIYEENN